MVKGKRTSKVPASKRKSYKKCSCCGLEQDIISEFYVSSNPIFSSDERVPICKTCVRDSCVDKESNVINEEALKSMLKYVQKPYFKDDLASAYAEFAKGHSTLPEENIKYFGDKILGIYFKNTMLKHNRGLSYDDSEAMGFLHSTSNSYLSKKDEMLQKYSGAKIIEEKEQGLDDIKWTKKDKQNMKYVISTIGYNPFDDVGLSDSDKKYCFNILAGYCDTEGVSEDGHKLQSVIEITMLYCQCRKITETLNMELSKEEVESKTINSLTSSKSSLLSSISAIAKDNNIASNYNKNAKQGQGSLTLKMKEMSENGFQEIKVNLFNIKTSEAFRQIDAISNENIAKQLTLDNNDLSDIIKEQREELLEKDTILNELSEENRILKNKIIDLENRKR